MQKYVRDNALLTKTDECWVPKTHHWTVLEFFILHIDSYFKLIFHTPKNYQTFKLHVHVFVLKII